MKAILSIVKNWAVLCLIFILGASPAGLARVSPAQAAPDRPTWQEITPQAGSVRAIVVSPAGPLYLGTNDGVFRQSGKGWVRASEGLGSPWISSLVGDPRNPLVLYASTNEIAGVYKSTDGGSRWALATNGLSGEVRTLAIDPLNGTTLYAQTASQIYKSVDGGATWHLKSQGIATGVDAADLLSLRIAPSNPSVLYVSEITGHLYRSANGGETWVKTAPLLGERAWTLTIDPAKPNTVYVGTAADGVYLTTNGGQTWVKRNQGMPNGGLGQSLNSILIDPHRAGTVYASMNAMGLYKTTDAGLHWSRLTSVGGYAALLVLAAHPTAAGTIYAGFEGLGFYVSPNGGETWSDQNRGLSPVSLRSLAPDPKNATVLYANGGSAGVFKTSNRGIRWEPKNTNLEFLTFPAIAIDPQDNRNVYLGADGMGFYRSTDAGQTWTHVEVGPDVIEIYALAVNPLAPNILYLGAFDHGVFKSTDYGRTWSPAGLQEISTIALAVDPLHPETVYAGADGVWKSTDGGEHFARASTGINDGCVNLVTVDPLSPETVYAVACDTGLYKSTDAGAHWSPVTITASTSTWVWVSAFALDPQQPSVLYAAMDKHLYRSPDGGASWDVYESGLPEGWGIDVLAVSPAGKGCVYAGGFYAPGLYSTCAPAPAVNRLSRSQATAGEAGFTLEVAGLGFTEEAAIRWQGADLPTTFVDSQTLTAGVSEAQLAAPSQAQVDVSIPAPGAAPSEPLAFTVSLAGGPRVFLPLLWSR